MSDVLRIIDRFKLTGGRTIYLVKNYLHSPICIGDLFFDLRGNRFKVEGIEMVRRCPEGTRFEDLPLGLCFELVDGVDAEGNILVRSLQDISFLFCSHPFYTNRVDESFEAEYQAAGLDHPCALFSLEDLEKDKLSLYGEDISGLTIYRGWMLKPDLYRTLYNELEEKGILLINTPEEYERYHLLPGWYDDFKEDTPRSVWESNGTVGSAMKLAKGMEGPFVVKDYVKSRKHEWYDACFIRNISDRKNAETILRNFIDRQGEDLVGGVVLRKFERLTSIGFHEKSGMPLSEEYRVFVYAGSIMIADNYWKTEKKVRFSEEEHRWLGSVVGRIKSNFVTIDLARREDDKLIIMELGDGQVSGLQQIDPNAFYRSFSPQTIHCDDIPIETAFPEGTVILAGDPMPGTGVEEMEEIIAQISTTRELVDTYVSVHNKFWFIEDDLYDHEVGTEAYEQVRSIVDAWRGMWLDLERRVMETAEREGLLAERRPDTGTIKQLEAFMEKYGYRDGRGWWVESHEPE